MATKKSSKKSSQKSSGTKKSAAKKKTAKPSGQQGQGGGRPSPPPPPPTAPPPPLNGNPPVILGGGSIFIYSDQELVVPNPGEAPVRPGYPFVLVYPDRLKDPVHVNHRRNGAPVRGHRHGIVKATDTIEIETD